MLAAAAHSDTANIIVLLVGVIIAVPSAGLAFLTIRDRSERREERRINAMIARQLVGEHAVNHPAEPSPDNPSIRDLLHDMLGESAAATAELAIIKEILRFHLSVEHGGHVPDYLLRK